MNADQRHEHVRQLRTASSPGSGSLSNTTSEHGEHREPLPLLRLRRQERPNVPRRALGAGFSRPRVVERPENRPAPVQRPHRLLRHRGACNVAGECPAPARTRRRPPSFPQRRAPPREQLRSCRRSTGCSRTVSELVDDTRNGDARPGSARAAGSGHLLAHLFCSVASPTARSCKIRGKELGVVHEHQHHREAAPRAHPGVDGRGGLDASAPHHLVVHVPEVRHLHIRGRAFDPPRSVLTCCASTAEADARTSVSRPPAGGRAASR